MTGTDLWKEEEGLLSPLSLCKPANKYISVSNKILFTVFLIEKKNYKDLYNFQGQKNFPPPQVH